MKICVKNGIILLQSYVLFISWQNIVNKVFAYLIIIRKFATQKDCISEFAAYKTVDNNHKFL